jgi:anti-sigma factor RsiW
MISCDDCQKKMVAVLDNESSPEDVKLVFDHLADCTACRAFYNELISARQLFSIATAMKEPVTIGRDFMRTVEADALHSRKFSGEKHIRSRALSRDKFSRAVWAGGAAAAFLIVASWLACYSLARKVSDVNDRLHAANQDLAVIRAEKQIEEDREKEQKAITALYLRMAELESRVERYSSPRTTFLQTESYRFPDRQGNM